MYVIVGLGNPGAKYEHTRHNVGFDVLDKVAEKCGVNFTKEKEQALIAECFVAGEKVLLVKPQTYMNLSGVSVAGLARYYKIPTENILVIYDDIDLLPGNLRIRKNGSAGTHNGMRSIIAELGEDNFPRLRVGIGGRDPHYSLADWVLSRYDSPEAKKIAEEAYQLAADATLTFIKDGVAMAMQKYNTKKQKIKKVEETPNE